MNSVRHSRESTLTYSSGDGSSSGSDHDNYKNDTDAKRKTSEAYIQSVLGSKRTVDQRLKMVCSSMNIFANRGDTTNARRVIDLTYRAKITPNVHMYTILIKAFNKAGTPHVAFDVLQEMRAHNVRPNAVTFNHILSIHNKVMPAAVAEILGFMNEEKIEADLHTFNCILDHLCRINRIDLALNMLEGMEGITTATDTASYNTIMNAYCKLGLLDQAEVLLQRLQNKGHRPDVFSYTILIDAYGKTSNPAKAFAHFRNIQENNLVPSVVTCNNLLGKLRRENNHENIVFVLRQMKQWELMPDEKTYSTVGEHLCSLDTQRGKDVLKLLERSELYTEDKTYARLIHSYVLSGNIEQAKKWYSTRFPLSTSTNEVDLHNCLSFGVAFIKVLLLLESPNKAKKISVINTKDCYTGHNEKMAAFVWNNLKKYYISHGNAIYLEYPDEDLTKFEITFPWHLNPNAADFVPANSVK